MILAGGRARRMGGGQKALVSLADEPLVTHVARRLRAQAEPIAVNAPAADRDRIGGIGLPIVPDTLPGRPGPLAGILAAMRWAAALDPRSSHVLTVPTDTPFLPPDLVDRLRDAVGRDGAGVAYALSDSGPHPVIGLWPLGLADRLERAIVAEGVRKVRDWTGRLDACPVSWSGTPDPFVNLNTQAEVSAAEGRIAAGSPERPAAPG